jgi:hypothetical protein
MAALDPNALADAIEAAMPQAWQDAKGTPFPGGDPKDRRPIFLAISRALLKYLHDNQSTLITSLSLSPGGPAPIVNTVSNVSLNITGI